MIQYEEVLTPLIKIRNPLVKTITYNEGHLCCITKN